MVWLLAVCWVGTFVGVRVGAEDGRSDGMYAGAVFGISVRTVKGADVGTYM